ncbi:MAG: serine/threonine-protein kinase [Nannocystales bacterium]
MDQIGDYDVLRPLGEGGMGMVYAAKERLSGREVALKTLRPELAASPEGQRLFRSEMTILAHLDHPNVVRCLACSEIDGQLVMAMELLDGPSLRAMVQDRGRVAWMTAVQWVSQIAAGLHAAHSQEPAIIHRDLKPENVLITGDGGTAKVADFGVAKVLEALHQTTTHSVGTLSYMSPEQIDAAPVDARADLYALGVVFYELLAGVPPFQSASPRELLNLHCTAAPPPLPDEVRDGLPKGVERLVFSLLEKRPEDRPQSAGEVVEQLEPFSTSASAAVARTTTASPASKPATAMRPVESSEPVVSTDTIALIERAAAPATIGNRVALSLLLVITAVGFALGYASPWFTPAASGVEASR